MYFWSNCVHVYRCFVVLVEEGFSDAMIDFFKDGLGRADPLRKVSLIRMKLSKDSRRKPRVPLHRVS